MPKVSAKTTSTLHIQPKTQNQKQPTSSLVLGEGQHHFKSPTLPGTGATFSGIPQKPAGTAVATPRFSCKHHHKRLVLNKCCFGMSIFPEKAAESSLEMQIPEKMFQPSMQNAPAAISWLVRADSHAIQNQC
jgi:hypothetical protein